MHTSLLVDTLHRWYVFTHILFILILLTFAYIQPHLTSQSRLSTLQNWHPQHVWRLQLTSIILCCRCLTRTRPSCATYILAYHTTSLAICLVNFPEIHSTCGKLVFYHYAEVYLLIALIVRYYRVCFVLCPTYYTWIWRRGAENPFKWPTRNFPGWSRKQRCGVKVYQWIFQHVS